MNFGINILDICISKNALHQAPFCITGLSTVIPPVGTSPCKGCTLGKMHDCSYPALGKRAICPLGLVHMDFIGPMPMESHSRACYVLTFNNDYSGYALVMQQRCYFTAFLLQTHINFPRFLPIFPDFLEQLSHLAPIY